MSALSSRRWSLKNRAHGHCYSCNRPCVGYRCETCRDRINAQRRIVAIKGPPHPMKLKIPKSVGRDTLKQLRRRYFDIWGREWPENNAYLKQLWLEARELHACSAHVPPPAVWQECLTLMRESHTFNEKAQ